MDISMNKKHLFSYFFILHYYIMDLKQYRARIANQAIELNKQAGVRERLMNSGEYQTPRTNVKKIDTAEVHRQLNELKQHYAHTVKQLNKIYPQVNLTYVDTKRDEQDSDNDDGQVGGSFIGKKIIRKTMKKVKAMPLTSVSDDDSSSDDDDSSDQVVQGGKIHFVKSMKKFGNEFGHALKKAGINEATKVIAQEGVKFAKNNIGNLINGAEEVLPEALPIAEEVAPLALAAGMKKPKRTRTVSDKEKRRHALIKHLMQKHNCSLAVASKHIKEKNIDY